MLRHKSGKYVAESPGKKPELIADIAKAQVYPNLIAALGAMKTLAVSGITNLRPAFAAETTTDQ